MQALLLLADAANITVNGKLNVLGIFNQIYVRELPARQPQFFVVIKIVSDIGETSDPRKFTVSLVDDGGTELGRVDGEFNFPQASSGMPRPEANIIFPITDLVFSNAGMFHFTLLVNGRSEATRQLLVSQISQTAE